MIEKYKYPIMLLELTTVIVLNNLSFFFQREAGGIEGSKVQ